MESFKYSDLLLRLEGFDQWLRSLGLTPHLNDRIHEAFKVLRKAEKASRRGHETGVYTDIHPKDWFPIIESLEAHDVFNAFQNEPSPAVTAALKRALSGPIHPIDERPKNRDARNVWYELTLAAEWKLRGAKVFVTEPDLQLIRDGIIFLVACKRPANEHSIRANIRDAIEQLQENFKNAPPGAFLETELDKHRRYLVSVDDPRICCVMFEVATPSVGGQNVDLVRASYSVAQELKHPSIGSKTFKEHAREMGSRTKR